MPAQITPFAVDENVMKRIRPMQLQDIKQVAAQHYAAMGHSLWAQLGVPFLETLYRGLLQDPLFVAYVYIDDEEVQGFIAGSLDVPKTFNRLWSRSGWRLLGPTLLGLLRRPQLLKYVLTTPLYFIRSAVATSSKSDTTSIKAESLFCSFRPQLRGTRISGHINKVLFQHFLREGCRYIKITTETSNQASLRQLSHWGFEIKEQFNFYGKDMYVLTMDLQNNPRLHDDCQYSCQC
ncbi:MAG: hypothetical protein ACI376_07570 [Candidatus Bruticola sp.]